MLRAALVSLLRIVLIGFLVSLFSARTFAVSGQADPSFGESGHVVVPFAGLEALPYDVHVLSNGKILVAGICNQPNVGAEFCIARLHGDGSIDTSFGDAGRVLTLVGQHLAGASRTQIQGDGKIVVGGGCVGARPDSNYSVFCLVRYLTDGSLDSTFGLNGVATARFGSPAQGAATSAIIDLAIRADGRIVALGSCQLESPVTNFCVAQFLTDGTLDASFGTAGQTLFAGGIGYDVPASAVVDSAGRVVLAGTCYDNPPNNPVVKFCLLRLTEAGTFDVTFGTNGKVLFAVGSEPRVARVLFAAGEKIVVSGTCMTSSDGGGPRFCLSKFLNNGAIDVTFGTAGSVIVAPQANALHYYSEQLGSATIDGNGLIVANGSCYDEYQSRLCAKRLLADGKLDTSFGTNGSARFSSFIAVGSALRTQADQKIVSVGSCEIESGTIRDFCVIRLRGGPYNPLTCALNLDANATIDPATDALLITRYLLGYRGDALTTSAVGASPTRTNAEIETYLGALMQAGTLDADGDGQSLAMTDGLLLIRAMLGLAGTALTNGATNAAHPNVRDAQQILTWIETTHGVACLP
ncbi:MAG: hypothetical protein KA260_15160 [Burkholderiales bacterium]|nr:hypothetical protein [Burkholderiales bacterium]